MGKKKTTQTQTNTPGFATPPMTAATTALQGMVDKPVDYATPIRNQYARAKQNVSRSYNNPLGAYTTADVRDKSIRAQHSELDQNLGMALGEAAQQSSADQFNRQQAVAALTAPQFYNASSTNVTSQPTNWLGLGASVGSSLGSAALM